MLPLTTNTLSRDLVAVARRTPGARNTSTGTLVLMRGVPSSGKSHTAATVARGDKTVICSADDFFDYSAATRDPQSQRRAHESCQAKAAALMIRAAPLVVIDNTNLTAGEMEPYFQLAVVYGYAILLQEPTSPWWQDLRPLLAARRKYADAITAASEDLARRNAATHKVPAEAIRKMLMRFQLKITIP